MPVNPDASATAVIVIFDVPSKDTPLIVLAVCSAVAVPALPVTLPLIGAVTAKPLNVPTDVIFGCAAVVIVPPMLDAVIPPDVTTDVGVILPNDKLIEGVVFGLVTVPEIPFAVTTETEVTPADATLPKRA